MEVMRFVILAMLAVACHGQDTTSAMMMSSSEASMMSSEAVPTPTSTMMPMTTAAAMTTTPAFVRPTETAEPGVRTVTANRAYRDEDYYGAIYSNGIYENTRAARLRHFNCHERAANGSIINRVEDRYIFSLYLQMPVLHFLNLDYKTELMTSIASSIQTSSINNICLDGYDQNFVGEFEEGVLLRIYESIDQTGSPNRSGEELRDSFQANFRLFSRNFEDKRAFNYITDAPPGTTHPMYTRAAVIGSLRRVGRVTIRPVRCRDINVEGNYYNNLPVEISFICLDQDQQADLRSSLAENPNPVNFNLEDGDYVFAVIGAIACAIVIGLAILGYFIHPFFLA